MQKRKFLSPSEVRALLDAALDGPHPERNHCLIMMTWYHGLRASEALRLRLSDIDISGRTLFVRRLKNSFSTIQPSCLKRAAPCAPGSGCVKNGLNRIMTGSSSPAPAAPSPVSSLVISSPVSAAKPNFRFPSIRTCYVMPVATPSPITVPIPV
ncbi:DNA recombinase [Salmonella enterica subsp. salamae]|nr:DNA recombinase [Salmonella enterica subsp. salamae]